MRKSIITGYEVQRYALNGREYPLSTLNDLKFDIEFNFFVEQLSEELYNDMISLKVDYSSALPWSDATTYAEGQFCIINDSIFESKVAGNLNHNPKIDTVSAFWKDALKFKNADSALNLTCEKYQDLYEKYIRGIVSNLILKESIPFDTMQLGGKGLTISVNPDNSGQASADIKSIEYRLRHTQRIIDTRVSLMRNYLILEHSKYKKDTTINSDWSLIPFVVDSCNTGEMISTKKGLRRFGFRAIKEW